MMEFIFGHHREIILYAIALFYGINLLYIMRLEHLSLEYLLFSKNNPLLTGKKQVNWGWKEAGLGYTKKQKVSNYVISSVLLIVYTAFVMPTNPLLLIAITAAVMFPQIIWYAMFLTSFLILCVLAVILATLIIFIINPTERRIEKRRKMKEENSKHEQPV